MAEPDTFGRRLRAARLAAGLTLQTLAEEASLRLWPHHAISHQAVSRYEMDIDRPLFATVCALADVLGVGVESLRPEKDQKKDQKNDPNPNPNPDQQLQGNRR